MPPPAGDPTASGVGAGGGAATNTASATAGSGGSALSGLFVAPDGDDANPGSAAAPFRTVQRCASVAKAGDTCYLHQGTYRERVAPASSGTTDAHITFTSYPGERAVVSGADLVTGWTVDSGNIYRAAFQSDLGEGNDQVFVDGQMMNEARWPNTGIDPSHPTLAHVTGGTRVGMNGTLDDPAIAVPAGTWDGAYFTKGNATEPYTVAGVFAESGTVTHQTSGQLTVAYRGLPFGTTPPENGNPYFLFGKRVALDAPTEWFYDAAVEALYLWTKDGDDPNAHVVEARSSRSAAFDLKGRSFVDVKGLDVFAATIEMDAQTTDCHLSGLDVKYVSHFLGTTDDATPRETQVMESGIRIDGTRNVLDKSTIAFSAGNGVLLLGDHNVVTQNVITDVDYIGTECAGVSTGIQTYPNPSAYTSYNEISWNTIARSGRGLIIYRTLQSGRILHNDLSAACLQRDDCGAMYTRWIDGSATASSDPTTYGEVAFNVVHDVPDGAQANAGLYFDDLSHHFVAHHNVVYGVQLGVHTGAPSALLLYDNTFAMTGISSIRLRMTSLGGPGNEIRDNILDSPITLTPPGDMPAAPILMTPNLAPEKNPSFVSPATHDYELGPMSPAIDAGVALPPFTDGFLGAAPDLGALESGAPPFGYGASATP